MFYKKCIGISSKLVKAGRVFEEGKDINQAKKILEESGLDSDTQAKVVAALERNFKIDNFIERGIKSGKTIGKINNETIIRELHNVTEAATEVSRALKTSKIQLIKLDEADFFDAIKKPGEKLEDIKDVLASQIGDVIYIKNGTSLDKAFGEIVHEGKHALDHVKGLFEDIPLLRKETKLITHDKVSMKSIVDKMTDDQVIELRARIVEREFQQAAKQKLDFSSVEAMISYIFKIY